MSRHSKPIKRAVEPNVLQVKSQLPELRTKILIGHKTDMHNELMDYLREVPYKYGTQPDDETTRPNHIGKPFSVKCGVGKGPAGLLSLIDFFAVDRRIDLSEISTVKVTIFPPPLHSSTYENVIEPAQMIVGNRCIYYANSDELIHYKMIDAAKLQATLGMAIPRNASQSVPEHVERGYGYHMTQTSAVALSIKFSDTSSFKITIRDGKGSKEKSMDKKPLARYIVVIDYIMTNAVFRETMKKTAGIVGDIADSKPGTVQGNMAKAALKQLADEDEPLLVDVPEDEQEASGAKLDSETSAGYDSDVEDVIIEDSTISSSITGNI